MTDERTSKPEPGFFAVKVEDLARGPQRIDADLPLDWLAQELALCEYPAAPTKAHLDLTLEAVDGGVLARGVATARVRTECGACLAEIHLDLNAEMGLYLMPRGEGEGDDDIVDADLTPEDLEREWFSGDVIVVDDMVRDAIMLELPMNPRCEDECASAAGFMVTLQDEREKGIDPRLAPLARIKISKE